MTVSEIITARPGLKDIQKASWSRGNLNAGSKVSVLPAVPPTSAYKFLLKICTDMTLIRTLLRVKGNYNAFTDAIGRCPTVIAAVSRND